MTAIEAALAGLVKQVEDMKEKPGNSCNHARFAIAYAKALIPLLQVYLK